MLDELAPKVSDDVPALHSVHVLASAAPTAVLKEPWPQSVHEALPVEVAYEPAAHGTQAAADVAPAVGEAVPRPHAEQVPDEDAPTAAE